MDMQQREREMRRRREQERRRGQKRTAQKQKNKKKAGKALWICMLCLLLAGGLIVSAYTFLFPVKTVLVEGNSRYTTEQIIEASGIVQGDNLLALDPREIGNTVRMSCPYIHSVSLQRKLPSTVVLGVTEGAPVLSFLVAGEYYLVNDRYELMEINSLPMGGTVVHGVAVTSNGIGKGITVEQPEMKTLLDSIRGELTKYGVTQITQMDLRDGNNIRFLFADCHVWELGNDKKLGYKIEFGAQISKKESGTGIVNLTGLDTGKNGYFTQKVLGDFVPMEQVTPTDIAEESEKTP